MKIKCLILSLVCLAVFQESGITQSPSFQVRFDFYGDPVELDFDHSMITSFDAPLSEPAIRNFTDILAAGKFEPIIRSLLDYKTRYKLDDWLYYQLIRKVAQQVSPKKENYERYTLYKWFLLVKSGYDARLNSIQQTALYYGGREHLQYPILLRDGNIVCLNTMTMAAISILKDNHDSLLPVLIIVAFL